MNEINDYDKLTSTKQNIVDRVLKYINEDNSLWKQGWKNLGRPVSAMTGKAYTGINDMLLTLVSMDRNYQDNRWITFNKIIENGYSFKTDERGKSLGKGNGVPIEFFELRDKKTKKPFDRAVIRGLPLEEQLIYEEENVYAVRKHYIVFNADIVDGIPEREKNVLSEEDRNDRVDNFIDFWSDKEVPIYYGGDRAYYSSSIDEIHLPPRNSFITQEKFYCTALHEIGHSTGHSSRLNRKLGNEFGSEEYAIEELRAQFASMFLEQDFGIEVDDESMKNNSAYIKSWKKAITNDPDVLFKAITDAEKISKHIKERESEMGKQIEYFAVKSDENELGEQVFELYRIADYGQITRQIDYKFKSKEELLKEVEETNKAPLYKDAIFKEVTIEKLQELSKKEYELKNIQEEKSDVYIRPSEVVAMGLPAVAIDMTERGIDSLTSMSDREVVEKARAIGGETFKKLYNGERVFESEHKDEKVTMYRVAMYSQDAEQTLRVFKSSGQYRESKPNSYYLQLAEMAMKVFEKQKELTMNNIFSSKSKVNFGFNEKV